MSISGEFSIQSQRSSRRLAMNDMSKAGISSRGEREGRGEEVVVN